MKATYKTVIKWLDYVNGLLVEDKITLIGNQHGYLVLKVEGDGVTEM